MRTCCSPKVSAIIPCYNEERTLGMCIESLLKQTYAIDQIIVVDDHSVDNTYKIAKNYPVTVLQTQRNSGVAAARNLAMSKATGDIFLFIDADVVASPNAVDSIVLKFNDADDIVSIGGILEPYPLIRDSIWEECRALQSYVWRKRSLGDVSALFPALAAVRKAGVDCVGYFNENLLQTEEIDYGERLRAYGRIILTDSVRGQHDDEHEFSIMMKKFWRRSQDRVPFYIQKRALMKGFESPNRLFGTFLTGVFWVALLGLFWFPFFSIITVSVVFIAIFINEIDIYKAVSKYLGLKKIPVFFVWYLCFHTAAGLGILSGVVKFLFFSKFRNMYAENAYVS